uniref:Uncharacterized protein n=1 Tax=Crocodylus porosus TaxID=8502 RepID=A0A7M4FZW4_CROPO
MPCASHLKLCNTAFNCCGAERLRSWPGRYMSRKSRQQGDMDGAWRLGRMARLISTVCIILGTIIIVGAYTSSTRPGRGLRPQAEWSRGRSATSILPSEQHGGVETRRGEGG